MAVSTEEIKTLREETACGVMECKRALEEAGGDLSKAREILKQRGMELAAKKEGRTAGEGRIEAYVHLGNKIGVLLEVDCESDFVAKGEDMRRFARDVAMHIAAAAPRFVAPEDVPPAMLEEVEDRDAFLKEQCLLEQPFVKDPSLTVRDCLNGLIGRIKENIVIRRFVRYQVGCLD